MAFVAELFHVVIVTDSFECEGLSTVMGTVRDSVVAVLVGRSVRPSFGLLVRWSESFYSIMALFIFFIVSKLSKLSKLSKVCMCQVCTFFALLLLPNCP